MLRAPADGSLALFCLARLLVELAQMVKLVANLGFETPRHWLIPPLLGDIFRKVVLSRCVRVRFVMRVAVVLLVAELLHELRWRIAQMQRHRACSVAAHESQ